MKVVQSLVLSILTLGVTARPEPKTPPPSQLADTRLGWKVGQAVDTDSGWVHGHASNIDPEVSEYLGIPWGQAPVGPLRFMPPVKANYSQKPIRADKFGPDCPQINLVTKLLKKPNLTPAQKGVLENLAGNKDQAEDCLTLNIWTKPQSGEKKKAVLVWVYGGGFSTGSTTSRSYDGTRFAANQDVVVVSINYRVFMTGFPSIPELFDDVNVGLVDQRIALEWVRDNIELFGGDSERITLFGQSAGGRSVDIYSYAWFNEEDPIVNGFIAQSGAAPQTTGVTPRPGAWWEVSKRLACGGPETGKASIKCIQSKTLEQLIAAVDTDASGRPNLYRYFSPVVDGKTYFADYDARRERGDFISKPLLTGNANNEGGLTEFINQLSGTNSSKADLDTINAGYTCGAKYAAEGRVINKIPGWRYRWMAEFPNQKLTPTSGAWHGSEISNVFGLGDRERGGPATPDQLKLGKFVNTLWAEFAKDPVNGLKKFKFPQYESKGYSLLLLGAKDNPGGVTLARGDSFDGACRFLNNTLPIAASAK